MKRNWLKKATAALVCVATAAAVGIGLTAPAYANAADTQITISAPQGDRPGTSDLNVNMFDGRSFTAYKLADYTNVQVSDGNVTAMDYKLDTPLTNAMVDGWIAKALDQFPITDVATVSNGTVTFKGDAAAMSPMTFVANYFYGTGADIYGNTCVNSNAMRIFAEAAQKSLTAPGVTATTAPVTVNNDSAVVDASQSGQGLYLIVDTTEGLNNQIPARAMITGTPVTVNGQTYMQFEGSNATYTLGSIKLKAEQVVNTIADTSAQKETLATNQSQRTFQVTANIPNYAAYDNWSSPTYSVTITPSGNVKLDSKYTVEVQPAGFPTWSTLPDSNYSLVSPAGAATGSLTVQFSSAAMKTSTLSGVTVRITVNGTVQNVTTTPTFVAAQATFSNDQSDANSTGTAEEASLGLFNTVIPVKKIAYNAGATSAALTGAQFSVTSGTTTVKFTESTLNGKPYYQVDPNGTLSTFTVGDGYIAGLGANTNNSTTYTITEKVAPTGYVLDGRHDITFNVTVTPNYTNDVLTSVTYKRDNGIYGNFLDTTPSKMTTDDGQTVNLESRTTVNNRYTNTQLESEMIHVKNTKNPSDFAQTGGHIVQVLIAMLIVAIVGAILLIVAHMRRRNNTDRTQIA